MELEDKRFLLYPNLTQVNAAHTLIYFASNSLLVLSYNFPQVLSTWFSNAYLFSVMRTTAAAQFVLMVSSRPSLICQFS
jgi:hypothetical protein